ncbi:COMM domain-containing protein 2 isoform X2 [Fundulus heteroclitus]|uniref:COMM domain-containing protein 2 isoform X2 n=1 Tax=Fundulus heteroclitus TaxID=8078 RepID=UPI000644BBCA|nr:COMM domain-containing protein 2 isoform X2 [Fundulus heteroclitus]
MLLVLSEDHKAHLSFLTKADGSVIEEFGRIALEFLRKGANPKIYEGAARKLCVPVGMVQHGVEGLMFLMTESSKHMLYMRHKHQVRSILSQLLCNQPAYHNLEWRLDVQLASRSVRQQIIPMVTIRLLLTSYDANSTHSCMDLQTDPSTLLHVISTLEAALAAMKTSHARRILRNIK